MTYLASEMGNPLSGGLRDRLRVALADASTELFVVSGLADAIRTLHDAVAQADQDRPSSPPGHSA